MKRKLYDVNNNYKNCSSTEISLSTGGPKMTCALNPKKAKLVSFSVESLDNYQVNVGASNNEMKNLTHFLRCNVGGKSVPAYYERHMAENSKSMENIYRGMVDYFDTNANNVKEKRPIVYADAEELVDFVIQKRGLVGNLNIKVMADSGQEFFKISISIFPENYLLE